MNDLARSRRDRSRLGRAAALLVLVVSIAMAFPQAAGAATIETKLYSWTSRRIQDVVRTDDFSGPRTFVGVAPSGRSVLMYWVAQKDGLAFVPTIAEGPMPNGGFRTQPIDPDDHELNGYGSFALDPTGRPSMSYISGIYFGQGILKYARRTNGVWTHEVVDPTQGAYLTALALDSNDEPMIAFTRTDGSLHLATKGPSGWVWSDVTTEQQIMWLDLAVDAQDQPRIAYVAWDGSNYVARLARFSNTTFSWTIDTVGHVASGGIEFGMELLIGGGGRSLMVYPVLDPTRGMAFTRRTASGWRTQLIQAGDFWQPNATFDANGAVNVVYYNATDGALMHAARSGTDWLVETVRDSRSDLTRVGRQSSIAFDANNRPRVAYYEANPFAGCVVKYGTGTPV
jgi:hypothetical protein